MVKYLDKLTNVVFEEIPDRVSLAISITNCQNNCPGCHSIFLSQNIGNELTTEVIDKLMKVYKGINCFLFMGEGNDYDKLLELNKYVKDNYEVETAIYSGRDKVEDCYFDLFDFVKVGSYKKDFGALNKETTNQRLYYHGEDITYKFWEREKRRK